MKDDVTKEMLNEICNSDVIVEVYVIATASEDEARTFRGIKEDIKGFVDCYSGTKIKGSLFAGGLEKSNDAKKREDLLLKAYRNGEKGEVGGSQ